MYVTIWENLDKNHIFENTQIYAYRLNYSNLNIYNCYVFLLFRQIAVYLYHYLNNLRTLFCLHTFTVIFGSNVGNKINKKYNIIVQEKRRVVIFDKMHRIPNI